MANYNLSLHNKIISQQMLDKLYHLWEETAKKQEDDFIFLSQSDFSKTKKNSHKKYLLS